MGDVVDVGSAGCPLEYEIGHNLISPSAERLSLVSLGISLKQLSTRMISGRDQDLPLRGGSKDDKSQCVTFTNILEQRKMCHSIYNTSIMPHIGNTMHSRASRF
ncbi:hypothetical protein RB195_010147 [Necator americanus]|uniref:Uncharacterized protein n=1 Tax=Necator americanus TaxID=51031 RepID=A0ABR1D002_NECAM